MAIVVRLGPLPLGRRRSSRVLELERIFATAVEIVEVFDVAGLAAAMEMNDIVAVALDASEAEELAGPSRSHATGQCFVRFGGVSATAEGG
jgi:hypothetical protein